MLVSDVKIRLFHSMVEEKVFIVGKKYIWTIRGILKSPEQGEKLNMTSRLN